MTTKSPPLPGLNHHHHHDIEGVEHPAQPAAQPALLPLLLGEIATAEARQKQASLRLQHQVAGILPQVRLCIV